MKINTLSAGYMTIILSLFSLPVMADDFGVDTGFGVSEEMDDVTIRVVDENDNSSAKVLSLPEQAGQQAVTHADKRVGYGLSKARDMHEEHRDTESVDGLADAISVANEHAKDALQHAMEARDMHNNAKELHGNSGMAGMNGNGQGHKPQ